MDASLVEGGHLESLDSVGDDATGAVGVVDAVLGHHLGNNTALDNDLELGAAGMDVERVHAAGVETTNRHAGSGTHEGWEGLAVGRDDLTPCTWASLGLVEVEDEVLVVGEEGEAVYSSVGDEQLLGQAESWRGRRSVTAKGCGLDRAGVGQDGKGDGGSELHGG